MQVSAGSPADFLLIRSCIVSENSDFLSVTIDFETSHLYFPKIIIGIIILLLLTIGIKELVKKLRQGNLKEGLMSFKFFEENYDKLKLFGSIISVALYFFLMDFIGRFFPNQGLGFLFASIPFMFFLSFLLVGRENIRNHRVSILISSVVTPLFAWILFAKLFYITLP